MTRGKKKIGFTLIELLAVVILNTKIIYAKTPLEFLKEAKKVEFRKGHTLPPLTRWGWELDTQTKIELVKNWGYAIEILSNRIDEKACKIAKEEKLPVFVIIPRPIYKLGKGFLDNIADEAFCKDENGNVIKKGVVSPEAPDIIFEKTGEFIVEYLNKVAEKAGKENIKIILNGGEYGLGVYGWGKKYWEKDPKVLKAKGERGWFEYISERKAHQESIIKKIIKKNFPESLYIYYHTEAVHRNRYPGWWQWSFDYKYIRNVSDLPSTSIYYTEFNSGFNPYGKFGDMLTQALNAVAQQIKFGDNLSYNWVNAGYDKRKFADLSLYMGYLKCYYTAGMIGGIAGYFSFPKKGGFKGDQGEELPHWLGQMMVLSYVHALFSHLEDYLRDGFLLPGPNKHKWSTDLPAYEFPTGDPYLRVLARKHNKKNRWLVTAWAMDGKERKCFVEIPEIGKIEITARGCGSVYTAYFENNKVKIKQLDENIVFPLQ